MGAIQPQGSRLGIAGLIVLLGGLIFAARAAEPAGPAGGAIPVVEVQAGRTVDFGEDVLPLFRQSCLACHNTKTAKGDLVLETPEAIQKGGETGPAAVPGNGAQSLILLAASHGGGDDVSIMPPKNNKVDAVNLTPEQLGIIKAWIDQGMKGQGRVRSGPIDWQPLPPGLNPIYACDVTPDGQIIASSRANQIFVYDAATQALITRLTDPSLSDKAGAVRPGEAHRDMVQSLAFSRDGRLLASGSYREVKLWRRPDAVVRQTWEAIGEKGVTAIASSADGKRVALGADDNIIRLVSPQDGKAVTELKGHTGPITALRFAEDGSRLYSASADQSVRIWDTASAKPISRIDTPTPLRGLAVVGAEEPLIVTGGGDRWLRVWSAPQAPAAVEGIKGPITAMALTPDGKKAAVSGAEGLALVDVIDGKVLTKFEAQTVPVTQLSFSTDGALLLTADAGALSLWNTAKAERVLSIPATGVTAAALHSNGKQAASASGAGMITTWDLTAPAPKPLGSPDVAAASLGAVSGDATKVATVTTAGGKPAIVVRDVATAKIIQTIEATAAPGAIALSADGARLCGAIANEVIVWTVADGKEVAKFTGHAAAVTAVTFHPDATHAVSGSSDGGLKLWTLADGKEVAALPGHSGAIVSIIVPASPQQIVSASADKSVRFFDAAGTQARLIELTSPATAMTFSRDGATLAVATADKQVRLMKAADGTDISTHSATSPATGLSFNADGTRLLVRGSEKEAFVCDVATGQVAEQVGAKGGVLFAAFAAQGADLIVAGGDKAVSVVASRQIRAIPGNVQPVTRLIYGKENNLLYSAAADGTIRGFDATTGVQSFQMVHEGPVRDLAISPTGNRLVSGGEDKTLRVWNAANGTVELVLEKNPFTAPVTAVTFTADGTRVVGVSESGETYVLSVDAQLTQQQGGNPLIEGYAGITSKVSAIASAAGKGEEAGPFLIAGEEGLRTFQPSLRRTIDNAVPATVVTAMPGQPMQFVTGGENGSVRLWNLQNGQQVREFSLGAPVSGVAIHPEGKRIAAAGGPVAKLWNPNGQEAGQMRGDRAAVELAQTKERYVAYAQTEIAFWQQQAQEATQRQQFETQAIARATQSKADATAQVPVKQQALVEKTAARDAMVKALADAAAALDAAKTAAVNAEKERLVAVDASKLAQIASTKAQQALQEANKTSAAMAEIAAKAKAASDAAMTEATKLAEAATTAQTAATTAKTASEAAAKVAADAKAAAAADPANAALAEQATKAQAAADTAAAAAKEAEAAYTTAQAASEDAAAKAKPLAEAYAAAQAVAEKAAAEAATAQESATAAQKGATDAAAVAQAATQARQQAEQAMTAATNAHRQAEQQARQAKMQFANADREVQQAMLVLTSAEKSLVSAEASAKKAEQDIAAAQANAKKAEAAVAAAQADHQAALKAATDAEKPIAAIAFSPDGSAVLTAGEDGAIRIWSGETGRAAQSITGHQGPVTALAMTPDGLIVSGSADLSARLWDINAGWTLERTIGTGDDNSPLVDRVASLAFSPDGTILATGSGVPSRTGELKFWSVADGKLVKEVIDAHSDTIYGLSFSGSGEYLASCSADKFVKVWHFNPAPPAPADAAGAAGAPAPEKMEPYTLARSFEGHTHHVLDVSFRYDGRTLVSVGADSILKTWNMWTGEQVATSRPDQYGKLELTSVAHIGFTDTVIVTAGDGRLHVVRERDAGQARNIPTALPEQAPSFLYCGAVTPDGSIVVAGADDSILRVRDARDGKVLANWPPPDQQTEQQARKQ